MLPSRIQGVMSPFLKNTRLASGDLQIGLMDPDETPQEPQRRMTELAYKEMESQSAIHKLAVTMEGDYRK